jgi:hypothetical protein
MASSPRTSKKRSKPPAKPKVDPAVRERLVLVLIAGASDDQALELATTRLELKPAAAAAALDAAKQAIVAAAEVDRRRELALAKLRLEELIAKAKEAGELKTQLAGIRELSKLLALYDAAGVEALAEKEGEQTDAERELAAVAGHLLPLELAKPSYPVAEHARIAADWIRRNREAA